ncbi:MAG: HAD family hydrolase [Sphaerochaetaceae bacterium]|jgi:putative hydrolase of the HAD superfamily
MNERRIIIFIDSGDTLIDEATEVRDGRGIVVHASLIEGAADALRTLHEHGYRIALVADGEKASFDNVYRENGLGDCFETRVISQIVGVQKPAEEMFRTAMEQMGLSDRDKRNIIMVGNNLRKDILGANRFGITSVWLDWSPRYFHEARTEAEFPNHIIHSPSELVGLVERLESGSGALREVDA